MFYRRPKTGAKKCLKCWKFVCVMLLVTSIYSVKRRAPPATLEGERNFERNLVRRKFSDKFTEKVDTTGGPGVASQMSGPFSKNRLSLAFYIFDPQKGRTGGCWLGALLIPLLAPLKLGVG